MRGVFLAVILAAAAAHWASPAKAGPGGSPPIIVEPAPSENPLLPCYAAQRRLERLSPRRIVNPMPGLAKILDCGLKWVALEPNSPQTAALAQTRLDELLNRMWRDRRFQGQSPNEAYFVLCGPGVATPAEIDQGILACLVGAAPLRPGEFDVVRVALKTADSP